MNDVKVTPVEEDPKEIEYVYTYRGSRSSGTTEHPDVFNTFVKDLAGLNHNFRRTTNRKLEKFHQSVDGEAKSKKIEEEASAYNYLQLVQPPYNLDYLAKLVEISPTHEAAIDIKASNIVGLGFSLVETPTTKRKLDAADAEKTKKMREKIARMKDELVQRIDDLNEEDSIDEILYRVWVDYEATGNGYIEIGRKASGEIGYVGHVPSTTMRIRRSRDGFIQITGKKAVFFRNFGDRDTPNPVGEDTSPNEIIHIKRYSPTSSFYGVPSILSAKNAVAGNEFASQFNLDYFENKAVPRHVIILKGAPLGSAAQQQLLEFFETGLKGQHHRSIFVPLPADSPDKKVSLEIKPVEAGKQDQSFDKYLKQNDDDINKVHRVPIRSGSQQQMLEAAKTFKNEVCTPAQNMLAKKMNKIVREMTDVFLLEFNRQTLTDEDVQSKIHERAIRNQWMVPNEVRAELGLSGLPGGDKIVELKPQQLADAKASQGKTRAEDRDRANGATSTAANGRSVQGQGRTEG